MFIILYCFTLPILSTSARARVFTEGGTGIYAQAEYVNTRVNRARALIYEYLCSTNIIYVPGLYDCCRTLPRVCRENTRTTVPGSRPGVPIYMCTAAVVDGMRALYTYV